MAGARNAVRRGAVVVIAAMSVVLSACQPGTPSPLVVAEFSSTVGEFSYSATALPWRMTNASLTDEYASFTLFDPLLDALWSQPLLWPQSGAFGLGVGIADIVLTASGRSRAGAVGRVAPGHLHSGG